MTTKTARAIRCPIEELHIYTIPNWTSEQVHRAFFLIRDTKFLPCSNIVGNYRSIPWFFVENGCFVRAALARQLLAKYHFPAIRKLFVFGDFRFQTAFSTNGYMTFKDHVAIAVRVQETVMVLDPALHYAHPLTLTQWLAILTSESKQKKVEASIGSPLTVSHNSNYQEQDEKQELGIRRGIPFTIDYFAMELLGKEYELLNKLNILANIFNC